jgi:bacteriorhodopsin
MNSFFEKLPNIYIVVFCFVLLLAIWGALMLFILNMSQDPNPKVLDLTTTAITGVFTLANTALGAVIGLAMKNSGTRIQTENVENVGPNADVKISGEQSESGEN